MSTFLNDFEVRCDSTFLLKSTIMFESNTDFDIDEDIFSTPFESDDLTSTKSQICTNNLDLNKLPLVPPVKKRNDGNLVKTVGIERLSSCDDKIRTNFASKPLVNSSPKTVIPRKFPGPAGLLPDRKDFDIDIKTIEKSSKKAKHEIEMEVCSQSSANTFKKGTWDRVTQDFSVSNYPFLPEKYNISWIKLKAKTNKLINQKAPFLAAIIQSIQCLKLKTAIIKIVLKDPSGLIHGMIVHDLYEEYMNELVEGSVIILKQFGVLTTDGSKHYITITTNNLMAIYSDNKTENSVTINKLQQFSVGDILRNIEEVKSRHNLVFMEQNSNLTVNYCATNLNSTPRFQNSRIQNQNNHNENINRPIFNVPNLRTLPPQTSTTINVKSKYDSNVPNTRNITFSSPKSFGNSRSNFKSVTERSSMLPDYISPERASLNRSNETEVNKNDSSENEILTNIFEGLDTDSLFDDF